MTGTRTEAERQELSGGLAPYLRAGPIRREFLPVAGDWKTTRNGLAFTDWLVFEMITSILKELGCTVTCLDDVCRVD